MSGDVKPRGIAMGTENISSMIRYQANNGHPFRTLLPGILLYSVVFLCSAMLCQTVFANEPDHLRITGVIKSVNAGTGIVMVEVTSSACNGFRMFKADNIDKLTPFVEERTSFFINSSICNVNETYTILTARGLRK